jgi:hypothetical protein
MRNIDGVVRSVLAMLWELGRDAPKGLPSAPTSSSSIPSTSAEGNRVQFFDGARGLFALFVIYGHIIKFYTSYNIAESTTVYMTVLVVAGFFVQSAFFLTYKFISDVFKIPPLTPYNFRNPMFRERHFRAIYLLVTTFFIRRFLRVYVPFFIICYAVKFGNLKSLLVIFKIFVYKFETQNNSKVEF